MRRAMLAAFAIAAVFLATAGANRAAAMMPAPLSERTPAAWNTGRVRVVDFACDRRCTRQFPPRQYWQWDDRPIWDDPWAVLKPNFWGSPEPHLVPADIWACEWHLPPTQSRRRHRRQCPTWQ
jgi:hypothetical protein